MSAHLPFHRSPVAPRPARRLPPSHLCCGPWGSKSSGGAETGPSRALGAYSSLFQQPLENIKAHSQLLSEAGVCSPQARPLRRPPLCIAGQPSNTPGPVPRREPRASAPRRHRSLEAAQEASTHPPTVQNQEPLPSLTPGGGRDSAQHLLAGDPLKRLPVQVRWRRFRAQDPGTQLRSHVLSTGHTQTPQPQLWTLGHFHRQSCGRSSSGRSPGGCQEGRSLGAFTHSRPKAHTSGWGTLCHLSGSDPEQVTQFPLCRRGRGGGASRSGWGREK